MLFNASFVRGFRPGTSLLIALLSCGLFNYLAPSARAQGLDFHRFDAHLAGGFTEPTGDFGQHLDTGWHITGGGGFNINRFLGIDLNVLYTESGINRTTLTALNQPDGNTHTWAFTLDPVVRFPLGSRASFYLTGGGGYFRRTIEFTKPTTALVTFFDPWFGFGQSFIPTNQVLGRFSKSSGGYDAGAGLTFKLGSNGASFYTEARYYYAPTEPTATEFVPVSFGLRW
jgi:opacity protein-like surface antigen